MNFKDIDAIIGVREDVDNVLAEINVFWPTTSVKLSPSALGQTARPPPGAASSAAPTSRSWCS